jgi:error-prone DNA polymerase
MPELPPQKSDAVFSRLARTIGDGSLRLHGDKAPRTIRVNGGPGPDSAAGYAELQVTSNFSFLRGASHPDELVVTAAALGHKAIAITDRNSVAGIVRAHHAAKIVGIRLVVGVRLDLADGTSLLAYPQERAAYGRLTRLLTLGKRRAAKGECRLDYADIVVHGEGQILILLSPELAAQVAADFPGRAYLAAHHLYCGDDAQRLANLAEIADATGLPLVAVNDVLYHVPERRPLQDVVTCIREHCTIVEAGYRLLAHAERHLKSPVEMARLFRGYEAALAHSLEIVDRCHFSLDELRYEYPEEPVPPGLTPQQWLTELTWKGATEKFAPHFSSVTPAQAGVQGQATELGALDSRFRGNDALNCVPDHIKTLIAHELALIERLDYARYFLTVHDIMAFARSRDILCQGRGSAANSVVCYCLGITSVDPAKIDVLFERFISAARGEPPDIDVDFEHERREEVIQHVYERYGRDRAGIAATVICYRARGAIREVGKVMGLSEDIVAALAGIVWGWSNEAIRDKQVREAGLDPADRTLRLALDLAAELIGFPRHLSQHVGGFVITRGPLSELVPIENAAMEDRTVIEWDKDDLDTLGILKIDVLALGMLTCIRKSFDLIERHYGKAYELHSIPQEQPEVYDMLSQADSLGVFQVESRAQMTMLPRLKPRKFYDLVIEVAIVRPGPIQGDMVHPYLRRRSGKEGVEYPSPELERVLKKTLGVPLFQEQAMQIAIVGAGFPPEEADRLRRAMATFKRNGEIHLFRDRFIAGMVANGYTPDFATRCFDQIEGFGTYGFPESHAASFALLVYVSAWIKCFYPDVFACALLNSQPMGFYAPAQIVRDAREHEVEVRPVDVNHSLWDCTLEPLLIPQPNIVMAGLDPAIHEKKPVDPRVKPGDDDNERAQESGMALRLGLRQVKGLAEAEARRLVENRGAGYRDAEDLARRSGLGRTALERLAAADALRSLDLDRRHGLWALKGLTDPPLPLFATAEDHPLQDHLASFETRPGCRRAAPQDDKNFDGTKNDRHPEEAAKQPSRRTHNANPAEEKETFAASLLPEMPLGEHVVEDYATLGLTIKRHPLAFLRAELTREGLVCARDLATLPVGRRFAIAGLVLIRQRPGSASGVVFVTIEDETGVANLIVWPPVLERFRRAALGATLLYCRGRLQREEGVIHIVAEDLRDWTRRLNTLRERTGGERAGDDPLPKRRKPPPFALPEQIPGYDARDIVIPSRDFR